MDAAARLQVLRAHGAGAATAAEVLAYNESEFAATAAPPLPLPDEPFVAVWEEYAAAPAAALRDRLLQLRFPIAEGISKTPEYVAATRRGIAPPVDAPGLQLEAPDRIQLFLHPTAAGRIPVLLVEHRPDFVAVVRALTRRSEPAPVPASQGAAMVAGYVNWDRVAHLRAAHERGELEECRGLRWPEAFQRLRERKELYQDRFVLLSRGPYSGVGAAEMGLHEEEWLALSRVIRLEHECAHYFTRRVFGSMRSRLLDEVIADYAGIAAAAGRFRADWFLRFMGLEHPSAYRAGGRLENYCAPYSLSAAAVAVLQSLVRRAAHNLETADAALPAAARTGPGRARVMCALASFTLEELASDEGAPRLLARLDSTAASYRDTDTEEPGVAAPPPAPAECTQTPLPQVVVGVGAAR